MNKNNGVALVVVMWVLVLLSVIASSFSVAMRTETALSKNMINRAKARALAMAGLNLIVFELAKPRLRITSEENKSWPITGEWKSVSFGQHEIEISVLDEAARIDINNADRKLLQGLLLTLGYPPDDTPSLLDAIEDWRDPNHLQKLNGAEDKTYEAEGLDYGAKDGPFESVLELSQVYGMPQDLFQRMLPYITIYSHQRGISESTAPRTVLMSIPGMDEGQVDLLLNSRGLPQGSGVSMAPESRRYLSARSGLAYFIQLKVEMNGTIFRAACSLQITHRDNNPYTIRGWMEDREMPIDAGNNEDEAQDRSLYGTK